MTHFLASLPIPAHQLPGGRLASSIRDAIVASSFKAHMAGGICSGLSKTPKVKRTRKRKTKSPTICQQAQRAMRLNAYADADRRQRGSSGGKMTIEQKAEGARLRADVQGPARRVADRLGWRHVPARDRE